MLRARRGREDVAAPEITVRRLGPKDSEGLAFLARENARFGPPGERLDLAPLPPADAQIFLSDDRTVCLVAFQGDEPVGFLYACELFRRHTQLRHLCLYEIGIDDEYRGLGIGSALIEGLGVHARARGIDRGFVITNETNRDTMELLRSVGAIRGADDDVVFILEF